LIPHITISVAQNSQWTEHKGLKMAQQTLNLGTSANDGTGDTLRVAGGKINSNFTEVYSNVSIANTKAQAAFDAANSYSLFDLSFTQSAYTQSNTALIMGQNSYNKANNTDYTITGNVAILNASITSNVANLRSEITGNVVVLNTSISSNVANLRSEITSNVNTINSSIANNAASANSVINTRISANISNVTVYTQAAFDLANTTSNTTNTLTANIIFSGAVISGNSTSNVTVLTSELINQFTSIDLFKNGDMNLYSNANVTILTDSSSSLYQWNFGKNGILTFPNGSTQSGGMMNLVAFKALVASSADFADFQSKVAAL
jgi:hypothetical protein